MRGNFSTGLTIFVMFLISGILLSEINDFNLSFYGLKDLFPLNINSDPPKEINSIQKDPFAFKEQSQVLLNRR